MEVLVEGVHYYLENGRWVFTEHYLRGRGYCCQSGCRHCPYEGAKIDGDRPAPTRMKLDSCDERREY